MSLGIDLSQSGHVLHRHELWPKERPRALQIVEKNVQEPQISQHELDKQAKAAILDLFPAIPRNDVEDIVNHAFELVSTSPCLVHDAQNFQGYRQSWCTDE